MRSLDAANRHVDAGYETLLAFVRLGDDLDRVGRIPAVAEVGRDQIAALIALHRALVRVLTNRLNDALAEVALLQQERQASEPALAADGSYPVSGSIAA